MSCQLGLLRTGAGRRPHLKTPAINKGGISMPVTPAAAGRHKTPSVLLDHKDMVDTLTHTGAGLTTQMV